MRDPSKIVRGPHGRFAYTGGRKTKGRKRHITQENVDDVKKALSRLRFRITPETIKEAKSDLAKLETRVAQSTHKAHKVHKVHKVHKAHKAHKGDSGQKSVIKPLVKSPDETVKIRDGHIRVWDGMKFEKHTGNFGVNSPKKQFEYTVLHEGKNFTLNRNRAYVKFQDERINGLPDMNPWLRKMSDQNLARRLTYHMGLVENNSARAPMWSAKYHGKADANTRAEFEAKGMAVRYGRMEIHHQDQWAKTPFSTINEDVRTGKITIEQAKVSMRANLVRRVDGKKGKEREDWWIDPAPKGQRELVVLPAQLHNVGSPLYYHNHPKGYDPDTGKLRKIAIPVQHGDGREWFNKLQSKFWVEVNRREVFILQ
jgi:hypothetical protein